MRLPSLLRLGLTVLPFLSLPTPTWALHAADAGVVDWHKHLVGAPMTGAAVTAPSFYRTIDEDTGTEESTILTATGNNVLAALKTTDGSVRWRYIFEKEDRILGYWKGETAIVSLSGPGGAVLRAFHPRCGKLLVESPIHDPAEAILAEPAWFVLRRLNFKSRGWSTPSCSILTRSLDSKALEGSDLIQWPLIEGFLLGGAGEHKAAVLLDEYLQVYLYRDNDATLSHFTTLAPSLFFPLRTTVKGQQRVVRHAIHPSMTARSTPASYGHVLRNRTTLCEYLNVRAFLLTSANALLGTCAVRVVDGAKDTVLYATEVKATPGRGCDTKAHLVENWLVNHYYEGKVGGGTVAGSTGYRMVTVELYERAKPDEKPESSSLSSFADHALNFRTPEQAYVFLRAITALAPMSTMYCFSTKDLISTLNSGIQSFPRHVLDARRPNRNHDSRRVLWHNYDLSSHPMLSSTHCFIDTKRLAQVANAQTILTSPTLLESTSPIFPFGLDMYDVPHPSEPVEHVRRPQQGLQQGAVGAHRDWPPRDTDYEANGGEEVAEGEVVLLTQ
ncbi:hypothetical protein D9619_009262 [Psilocybe cf. subviscida]|uniref:ER membrane protein complex subunit 1 n=1 Tax=Psilocybe cf. subviscida TaxID=2480587 RepID=A0A8H5BUH3_9AGAR|nr:hypothetical protein D9619_009262 [Psilocybe cf. subviscida]